MKFRCATRLENPSLLVAELGGALDAGTALEFESSMSGHLKDEAIRKIVLDVTGVTFLSSSGLRVMMLIIKALTPREGKLYVVGASARILELIKMAGMGRWIHVRDGLAACGRD